MSAEGWTVLELRDQDAARAAAGAAVLVLLLVFTMGVSYGARLERRLHRLGRILEELELEPAGAEE